ncbi:hypothetical protein NWE60_01485 [Mycoplasmopsis felis]|nr:hypothetical protein [Mycoplasmopsis felis]WAM01311.1 hypothetical protein NWE60_01485 [Mycoplasmopsis felis]
MLISWTRTSATEALAALKVIPSASFVSLSLLALVNAPFSLTISVLISFDVLDAILVWKVSAFVFAVVNSVLIALYLSFVSVLRNVFTSLIFVFSSSVFVAFAVFLDQNFVCLVLL